MDLENETIWDVFNFKKLQFKNLLFHHKTHNHNPNTYHPSPLNTYNGLD
jgi:hypothetical protein